MFAMLIAQRIVNFPQSGASIAWPPKVYYHSGLLMTCGARDDAVIDLRAAGWDDTVIAFIVFIILGKHESNYDVLS
jgi:hypothetical protein